MKNILVNNYSVNLQKTIAESKPLLEYLFNQMEKHDVTCRFKWNKGDLLIWDNRFTLHYPINDTPGITRKMIRTSVLETT